MKGADDERWTEKAERQGNMKKGEREREEGRKRERERERGRYRGRVVYQALTSLRSRSTTFVFYLFPR